MRLLEIGYPRKIYPTGGGKAFLTHLLDVEIGKWRHGECRSIRVWVELVAEIRNDGDPVEANRILRRHGLLVARYRETQLVLLFANYHTGLVRALNGSGWEVKEGTMGRWAYALRELPEAIRISRTVRFYKETGKSIAVPVQYVLTLQPDED